MLIYFGDCQLFHLLLFSLIGKAVFFTLLIVSLVLQNLLSLIRSYLFIFVSISTSLGGGPYRIFL